MSGRSAPCLGPKPLRRGLALIELRLRGPVDALHLLKVLRLHARLVGPRRSGLGVDRAALVPLVVPGSHALTRPQVLTKVRVMIGVIEGRARLLGRVQGMYDRVLVVVTLVSIGSTLGLSPLLVPPELSSRITLLGLDASLRDRSQNFVPARTLTVVRLVVIVSVTGSRLRPKLARNLNRVPPLGLYRDEVLMSLVTHFTTKSLTPAS